MAVELALTNDGDLAAVEVDVTAPQSEDLASAEADECSEEGDASHPLRELLDEVALGKEGDKQLRRAFKDLDQIKADVVYPFLLEVYSDYEAGTITHQEMLDVVEMVTSYVFRRAVCRIPTNSLNKTFAGFSSAVRKDRYLDSVKAHFLSMKS